AMGHVILKEFYVDRQVPYFEDYARRFTDLPFLVTLRPGEGGAYLPDRMLRASDLAAGERAGEEDLAEWKPVVLDERTGQPAVPNGSVGHRYQKDPGRWNLDLGSIAPLLTLYGREQEAAAVDLPRFDVGESEGGTSLRRGVPAMRVGGQLVTTVFDLVLARYGVARSGLPGRWPQGYDDPEPGTPAWQAEITSVDAELAARIGREFARNAELTRGRSMICMGAGTNHWYHSDLIYRTFLALLTLCGCEGVNGGGWAHYVGQEKVRPLTGWQTMAFALDWVRPPRHQAATPYLYMQTDQWRYEAFDAGELASPLGRGLFKGRQFADCYALAGRLGWMPAYPSFDRNPLDLGDAVHASGEDPGDAVLRELKGGRLHLATEDPDAPENFPRVLTVWRSNLLGSSGKGHEYFLKHLLGTTDPAVRAAESPPELRPQEVRWREDAPVGKLDLLTTLDFRMTSNALFSDVVLPAATWYEKYDLSTTDMHPFVHTFNQAIPPPWEARTDWDIFNAIAEAFSRIAERRLGVRQDLVAAPLLHDTPDEVAQPLGRVLDWKAGEVAAIPGRTMPRLLLIERDFGAVAARMRSVGPLLEQLGSATKGAHWTPREEVDYLARKHGVVRGGPADGRPRIDRAEQVAEAILALSGTTNGRLAVEGFRSLEERCGVPLTTLAEPREGDRVTFADAQVQPRTVITSPEWSGVEAEERRYSPFTINVERQKPWHTLTGRQHLYLDHEWVQELGEQLPVFKPPLRYRRHFGDQGSGEEGSLEVTVRYLTPHSKWSIHSEYQDNLHMLTLFRGGPVIWLSQEDARTIEVRDNDWIEAFNRNGVIACRAVVTYRVPPGVCIMYHAKDRHLNVPLTELFGERGGTDNSLTRIVWKPTHLVGGYAQLSFGFNYYGPTGSQRDEITTVRKRRSEVVF
ncbi:MAG: nitrate reductase subunit alpha, partial [Candidatus Dormibacteraceae bacterium]